MKTFYLVVQFISISFLTIGTNISKSNEKDPFYNIVNHGADNTGTKKTQK